MGTECLVPFLIYLVPNIYDRLTSFLANYPLFLMVHMSIRLWIRPHLILLGILLFCFLLLVIAFMNLRVYFRRYLFCYAVCIIHSQNSNYLFVLLLLVSVQRMQWMEYLILQHLPHYPTIFDLFVSCWSINMPI